MPGGPIQLFVDPRDSCLSPQLIAACHDLLRLSSRAIPQSGCSILLISTFPLSIIILTQGLIVSPLVSRHINSGISDHSVSPQGEAVSTTNLDTYQYQSAL